jgi:hypothetical protein
MFLCVCVCVCVFYFAVPSVMQTTVLLNDRVTNELKSTLKEAGILMEHVWRDCRLAQRNFSHANQDTHQALLTYRSAACC